ncbi:MAG: aspartate/glutamate racemase family protein [Bacillota bacterium]
MAKTIGILGGMGPAATVDLLAKIYANSRANSDQEHVRVLADIDPSIPDRTQAILSKEGEAVVAHLLRNARGLIAQGAQLLAMPCNTAHAFLPELEGELSVPFVNMVEVAVAHLAASGGGRIGLLATDGTLATGLYSKALEAQGMEVLTPPAREQADLMKAIYGFKGGEVLASRELAVTVYKKLRAAGAGKVIAACTELPILLAGEDFVDPTELLARELVRRAG